MECPLSSISTSYARGQEQSEKKCTSLQIKQLKDDRNGLDLSFVTAHSNIHDKLNVYFHQYYFFLANRK